MRHCPSPKENQGESSSRPQPPPPRIPPALPGGILSTCCAPATGTPGAAVAKPAGLAPHRGHQQHPGDMVVCGLTLSPHALLRNKG